MVTLLVASAGGHLKELHLLRPRIAPPGDVVWATADTPQSRSLLSGDRVVHVAPQGSRDVRGGLRNVVKAWQLLRDHDVDRVVSTGAGIALAFLPVARLRGIPCHYVESGTRLSGPSLTGRLIQAVPGVRCYTQHAGWGDARWTTIASVYDHFTAITTDSIAPVPRKIVVSLGTWQGMSFRGLLERLLQILPSDAEVVWQTGHTPVEGLPIDARPFVPADELARLFREADVVVAHAGMGTSLDALEAGKCPIIVPRLRAHGEHIDDHQLELARDLEQRGLALSRRPDTLQLDDLVTAAARRILAEPLATAPILEEWTPRAIR